jgi:hypothetical protein
MRKFLIALLVVVAVLVAADRVAAAVAGHEIANRVAAAYNLPAKPSVSVQGFPFLTQVASGDYQAIDVSMASVRADGGQVNNLDARFTGVHAPLRDLLGHGTSGITADAVSATGVVPFSTVRSRVPAGVHVSPDGSDLKLSGTVTYFGASVPVSADATLDVRGSDVVVSPQTVTVAHGISVPASLVAGRFGFDIPVTGLPLHLKVNSVSVSPGGVRVGASASNVQFTAG